MYGPSDEFKVDEENRDKDEGQPGQDDEESQGNEEEEEHIHGDILDYESSLYTNPQQQNVALGLH